MRNANKNYYRTGVQILELANKAYFLYLRQNHHERRKILDQVVLNCFFDNGNLSFSYKKPFDILAKGLVSNKWPAGMDVFLNLDSDQLSPDWVNHYQRTIA